MEVNRKSNLVGYPTIPTQRDRVSAGRFLARWHLISIVEDCNAR